MEDQDPILGTAFGKFRVLRKLGEGGMGAVYLAERSEDFNQQVALKLLLEGWNNESTIHRFRIEQQALAALQHPGIVQMVDAGLSDSGLPYLAMEYVDGDPLDHYCDIHRLSIEDRIRLMVQVLDAVDYAHQRFLVHCDLKSGNILVDSAGVVKLLDFGVSKLLQPQFFGVAEGATKATLRPFTPEYASPEQLTLKPLTTATDVYAAGVVLYGLLSGQHPFEEVRENPVKLLRAVCDSVPMACSDQFKRMRKQDRQKAETVAAQRGTRADGLATRLAGDLDAILRKALQNDPADRYGSAALLAADLLAYLNGQPVEACGQSAVYRGRRFLARNARVAVLSAALGLFAMAGMGSWVWQAARASHSRKQAEDRFHDVRQLTNTLLFDFYDAVEKLPGATPAQESLVRWSLEYLDELGRGAAIRQSGEADSSLQLEIAESYRKLGNILGNPYQSNLGKPRDGVDAHTKGLTLVDPIMAAVPNDRDAALMAAKLYGSRSQVRWLLDESAECLADAREALSLLEPLAQRHPRDFEIQMQKALQHEMLSDLIGSTYSVELDHDEAARHLRIAMEHAELAIQADPSQVRPRRAKIIHQYKLAELLALEDPAAALVEFEDSLARLKELPEATQKEPSTQRLRQILLRSIAWCRTALGQYPEAVSRLRELEPEYREATRLDPTNEQLQHDLAVLLRDLGEAHRYQGMYEECARDYEEVSAILGSLPQLQLTPQRLVIYGEVLAEGSVCLFHSGRVAEAAAQSEKAAKLVLDAANREDVADSILVRAAGALLISMPERSRQPRRALDLVEKRYTEGVADDPYYLMLKSDALKQLGRLDEAREAVDRAIEHSRPEVNINTWNQLQAIRQGL